MAKAGNHGQIIPRDADLLRRLYWTENRSLPEIGQMYGVTHKSIERVFRDLGIPRRKVGHSRKTICGCGQPALKKKHPLNGSLHGTKCAECLRQHRNELAREYGKRPHIRAKKHQYMRRWYLAGAINPNGEAQWLTKARHLLRNVRRHLKSPPSREAWRLRNEVSALVRNSQI